MKAFCKKYLGEKRKKWLFAFIVLAVAFIWVHSLLPGDESAAESGWFTEHIINPILGIFGLSAPEGFVRTLAHVTEYTVFSMLMTGFFDGKIKSVPVCFFVAFIDETLQIFSGRGPMIADVWIDMIGVTLGFLLINIIKALKRRRASRPKRKKTGGSK